MPKWMRLSDAEFESTELLSDYWHPSESAEPRIDSFIDSLLSRFSNLLFKNGLKLESLAGIGHFSPRLQRHYA